MPTDEFLLQILLIAQHVSGTIMPIIRSSRVLYKGFLPVVLGAWFLSCRYGVELRVVCPVCGLPANRTLELLMMGIMVPETCWASNKICNKNSSVASVGILFPHIYVMVSILRVCNHVRVVICDKEHTQTVVMSRPITITLQWSLISVMQGSGCNAACAEINREGGNKELLWNFVRS
jgi:hypothetical protein